MDREERVAQNEILFRQVNERIREIESDKWRVDPVDFMCECGDVSCTRVVHLATGDYERVRSDPRHFAVLPGHELPDLERVVERHQHYFVVEKSGEPGARAAAADPRS